MLSSQERTDLPGGEGYRGTIRTPSSKVGKKGMCKKGHGQEGRQGTSSTPSGLHNEKAHLTFLEFHSPRETSISVTK